MHRARTKHELGAKVDLFHLRSSSSCVTSYLRSAIIIASQVRKVAELMKQHTEQTSNLIDISFTYYMFNIHID